MTKLLPLLWILGAAVLLLWAAADVTRAPETSAQPAALAASEEPAAVEAHAEPPVPVLLVYGFQPLPGFDPPELWESIAEALSGRGISRCEYHSLSFDHDIYVLPAESEVHRPVFISDYAFDFEPTVRDLRLYAQRLEEEIHWVCERESVAKIDVIAFSMGALVVRAYVEASDFADAIGDPDFVDYGTTYGDDVRTLITIAGPHHGAAFAALGPWFGPLPRQLDPESSFFQLLNAGEPDGTALHPDVRYVSLAGQCCLGFGCSVREDVEACRHECVAEALAWSGHDLVILMSSARLNGAENVACVGFDHIEMRTHSIVVDALEALLDGDEGPDALFADENLRAAAGR